MQNPPTLFYEITYAEHFRIGCRLDATYDGLLATVVFHNDPLSSSPPTPSVEVWYPIVGYLEYIEQGPQLKRVLMNLYEMGDHSQSQSLDLKIDPGKTSSPIIFYTNVTLTQAERMGELADKFGIVTLNLHLYFSVLYKAGTLGDQKTFGFQPVFQFNVTKVQMQHWIVQWTSWYARSEDLPGSVPKNVLDDYVEATSTFNINAFRASSVMARRAL